MGFLAASASSTAGGPPWHGAVGGAAGDRESGHQEGEHTHEDHVGRHLLASGPAQTHAFLGWWDALGLRRVEGALP